MEECLEFSLEDHLYEVFTLAVTLLIAVGGLSLSMRNAILGEASIRVNSFLELALGVTALYLSLPVHELVHKLTLNFWGLRASFRVIRFKGIVPYIEVISRGGFLDRRKILIFTVLSVAVSLFFGLASSVLPDMDFPLLLLSLGCAAFSSWDVLIAFIVLCLPADSVSYSYLGSKVVVSGNCKGLSERFLEGWEAVRHWSGWTWFFFTVFFVMFVMVLLGAISFSQGFTLGFPGYVIFSVYRVDNTFKYFFNVTGAFMFSAVLAVPFSYLGRKLLDYLG